MLGFVLDRAEPTLAANIAIAPVNISLTRDVHSALLTVSNQGDETVRFTLSTFAWNQNDAGQMQLAPTSDIIFFPTQLTLAPGESRNVRLGTQQLPGDVERSYRIFLDELPSPQTAARSQALRIHVLSKIGVPIFLVPDKPTTLAGIDSISVKKSELSFWIHNMGSVHILPGNVSIEGMDSTEKPVLRKDVAVWYVLAGGSRVLNVALPAGTCAKLRSITISVRAGSTVITKSQPTPSGACAS